MIKTFLAAILITVTAGPALAQERDDEVSEATLQKFKAMYPNTNFRGIRKSKIPGIYELRMGENVAYADESGRYFIFGHLFDIPKQACRQKDGVSFQVPGQRHQDGQRRWKPGAGGVQ